MLALEGLVLPLLVGHEALLLEVPPLLLLLLTVPRLLLLDGVQLLQTMKERGGSIESRLWKVLSRVQPPFLLR